MRPQLLSTFHTSRLVCGDAGCALLATTEWPGVEPPDVKYGNIDALAEAYPDFREELCSFAKDSVTP